MAVPSVRLSFTRCYCVKTTEQAINAAFDEIPMESPRLRRQIQMWLSKIVDFDQYLAVFQSWYKIGIYNYYRRLISHT